MRVERRAESSVEMPTALVRGTLQRTAAGLSTCGDGAAGHTVHGKGSSAQGTQAPLRGNYRSVGCRWERQGRHLNSVMRY